MESKPRSTSVSNVVVAIGQGPVLKHQESSWADVVERMKCGDSTALAELYDGTSALTYGLIVKILGDGPVAEEALVEAYARAWSRIHTFDSQRSGLLAWLILLARGVALDRPGREARPSLPEPVGRQDDRYALERAFFDGVKEGDLRGALTRLREKKGEGAP